MTAGVAVPNTGCGTVTQIVSSAVVVGLSATASVALAAPLIPPPKLPQSEPSRLSPIGTRTPKPVTTCWPGVAITARLTLSCTSTLPSVFAVPDRLTTTLLYPPALTIAADTVPPVALLTSLEVAIAEPACMPVVAVPPVPTSIRSPSTCVPISG